MFSSAMELLRQLSNTPATMSPEFYNLRVQIDQPEMREFLTPQVADGALDFLDEAMHMTGPEIAECLQIPRVQRQVSRGVIHTEYGLRPGPLYAEMSPAAHMMVALRILQIFAQHEAARMQALRLRYPSRNMRLS